MIRKLKTIFFFLLVLSPFSGFSQLGKMKYRDRIKDSIQLVNTAIKPPRIKRKPELRGELSAGVRLNTDGYSFFIDKGYLRGGDDFGSENKDRFFQVRLFTFELSEIKHPKEYTSGLMSAGNPNQSSPFILGKTNNFYTVKLGYGNRRLIAGKPDPETISIHWVYSGGFSAGLLKPYYLQIYNLGEVKYSDSIGLAFISPEMIKGKAPFSKGFNEIQFIPGAFLKTGLHFDFASRKHWVSALEVGANTSVYTKKIQQFVNQDSKQLFFNFYISLQFGKRW